jgi:uncharacterized protein (TIGR02266 family)
VAAARDARLVLAEAVAMLDDARETRALASGLSAAVASLFQAEIGEPEAVLHRLEHAAERLGRVLQALHEPPLADALDRAGPLVARTLAVLHPARVELARELASSEESEVSAHPQRGESPAARSDSPLSRGAGEGAVPAAIERRSGRRVRLEAAIGAQSGARFLPGELGDVSSGGVFVATSEPLPVGERVTVALVLPDAHRIVVEAVVSWVRGPHVAGEGMALRFVSLSAADAEAIARLAG